MNSREESLRSTFLLTLIRIMTLTLLTRSPAQHRHRMCVCLVPCWFSCVSFQCVSVCPFYHKCIFSLQALQPPPAHTAPAGDLSMGSKATTSHTGYKGFGKSKSVSTVLCQNTGAFVNQCCAGDHQTLHISTDSLSMIRLCIWNDHDITVFCCVITCPASPTCAEIACCLSKCIDVFPHCSGMFRFSCLAQPLFGRFFSNRVLHLPRRAKSTQWRRPKLQFVMLVGWSLGMFSFLWTKNDWMTKTLSRFFDMFNALSTWQKSPFHCFARFTVHVYIHIWLPIICWLLILVAGTSATFSRTWTCRRYSHGQQGNSFVLK